MSDIPQQTQSALHDLHVLSCHLHQAVALQPVDGKLEQDTGILFIVCWYQGQPGDHGHCHHHGDDVDELVVLWVVVVVQLVVDDCVAIQALYASIVDWEATVGFGACQQDGNCPNE